MADSDSLRTRRHRRHKRGDHSLCRHGEDGARPVLAAVPAPAGGPLDPHAELEALAGRLAEAHKANPADAAIARVLKDVLCALPAGQDGGPDGDDDPLADLRALAESVS